MPASTVLERDRTLDPAVELPAGPPATAPASAPSTLVARQVCGGCDDAIECGADRRDCSEGRF